MSVDATRWAWQQQDISASQKLVLLALADRANEHHQCCPSIPRIVADTCLNAKTVQKIITDLIDKNLIQDTGKRVGKTQRTRVLKLVGVIGREQEVNTAKIGNIPKNGMIKENQQVTKSNTPEIGNIPKNGNVTEIGNITENGMIEENQQVTSVNDTEIGNVPKSGNIPKIGMQNLKDNINIQDNYICADEQKNSKGKNKVKKFDFYTALVQAGVSEQSAQEFMFVRKQKRSVDTETAFCDLVREAEKAHFTLPQAIDYCLQRQNPWAGFRAHYVKNESADRQRQQVVANATQQPRHRFGTGAYQQQPMRDVQ